MTTRQIHVELGAPQAYPSVAWTYICLSSSFAFPIPSTSIYKAMHSFYFSIKLCHRLTSTICDSGDFKYQIMEA